MNGVFCTGRAMGVIRKTFGATNSVLYGSLCRRESVGRESPFREDFSEEAEESPLLEVVTRERLVKTQQAGKRLSVCCDL
jgi:hypothetical protein